jgi:hypothetical protein
MFRLKFDIARNMVSERKLDDKREKIWQSESNNLTPPTSFSIFGIIHKSCHVFVGAI